MTNPPLIDTVPWSDASALAALISTAPASVTPLMLERLLEHHNMEYLGDMPSRGSDRIAMWAPRDRAQLRDGASFTALVSHSPFVAEDRVVTAINELARLRRARISL